MSAFVLNKTLTAEMQLQDKTPFFFFFFLPTTATVENLKYAQIKVSSEDIKDEKSFSELQALTLSISLSAWSSLSSQQASKQRKAEALQVLGVDDAGTRVLAGLQLHRGDEPAAGARGVVVERGAVSVLGVFGVDDGGALVADGPLPGLQVHLALVAPPGAVPHGHHRLAEGRRRGHRDAEHPVLVMLVGVVLDLRVTLDLLLRFGVDLDALSKEHGVHAGLGVGSRGVEQQIGQQFAFSAFFFIISMVAVDGRGAAGGARLDQTRRKRAEGRAGTGGQARVRTVEQPFPVLSFQTIIHRL